MTSSNYAYKTFDDIVFEGRNREYGAYLLRKVYTRNLWRGLVTAISLFMLFLSVPLVVAKLWPAEVPVAPVLPKGPEIIFQDIDIPVVEPVKPIAQPENPPLEKQKVETKQHTTPVIVENTKDAKGMLEQDELSKSTIGTETKEGDSTINPPVTTTNSNAGTGTAEAPSTVFLAADQMPEYPGGLGAMSKFLSNNIEYPRSARQAGIHGTVLLSFVVNQNGDISGIQVLQSPGASLEAEALRVLKKMPRWSPGKNNGIPVNVRFTLPIKFAIR